MPPAPHTCEYYTTETTAHHAAMLSDTLRNHAPAEDTMLALATCHIHRRVMGEDSPFNDNHVKLLRVFSYMSTPTTPLRLTFLRVDHDTWDEPRGFIRIHAGANTDDALPLTLSQTETTYCAAHSPHPAPPPHCVNSPAWTTSPTSANSSNHNLNPAPASPTTPSAPYSPTRGFTCTFGPTKCTMRPTSPDDGNNHAALRASLQRLLQAALQGWLRDLLRDLLQGGLRRELQAAF